MEEGEDTVSVEVRTQGGWTLDTETGLATTRFVSCLLTILSLSSSQPFRYRNAGAGITISTRTTPTEGTIETEEDPMTVTISSR